jgi:AraC family transcriptional regulator, regulatory protein of adaptative response / DNA-3-methyladenine glycosylase II
MILDGELNRSTEGQLARRLGVSARHLRRLFAAYAGTTPDALARAARLQTARRLLAEDDLTVLQVALAAGFGSLRQFNRSCRAAFAAAPRELRGGADHLRRDGDWLSLRLALRGPHDFPAILHQLSMFAVPGVEAVSPTMYRRTIVASGEPGAIEISAGGEDHLVLRVLLSRWHELVPVVAGARRVAGLCFDVLAAARALADDPIIGPLVRARPGIRPAGTWDLFEAGVLGIVGQDVARSAAAAPVAKLVSRHGLPTPQFEYLGLSHTFPSPERVTHADRLEIGGARECGVRGFATAVADGAAPSPRSPGDVAKIPGLAEEAAEFVAFRLGHCDAYPARLLRIDDRAAGHERWKPWRALAASHLASRNRRVLELTAAA